MLPIPELHLVNAPVIVSMVLFALLFVGVFWRKDKNSMTFGRHSGFNFIVFAIIMGIATNSTLLGSITRSDELYYHGLFMSSLIFYNLLCSTIWLIGITEAQRIVEHKINSVKVTTLHFKLGSWVLVVVVFVFSVAVVSLYVQLLNPGFDGDHGQTYAIFTNLEIASVLLRWLFLVFYAILIYKSYRFIDRRNNDILVAFGFLNSIPQLADSIYIITKSTFPNPAGLSFIMFFFTDFLLVANIVMIGLLWKVDIYNRLLPTKNENTTTTTPTA